VRSPRRAAAATAVVRSFRGRCAGTGRGGTPAGVRLCPTDAALTSVTGRHIVWATTQRARCVPRDTAGSGRRPRRCQTTTRRRGQGATAASTGGMRRMTRHLDASVFGAIEASGRVLMGERGSVRKSRITAVVTRNRRVAAACTQAGIAVYRRRRDLLRDHPPDDLSALLGDRPHSHSGGWWPAGSLASTRPAGWRRHGGTAVCGTDVAIRPMVAALAAATLTEPKEECMRFHTMGGGCGLGSAWAWPGAGFFWMGPVGYAAPSVTAGSACSRTTRTTWSRRRPMSPP
jgi:hypothetical protein